MRNSLGHVVIGLVLAALAACASAKEEDSTAKPPPTREVVSGGATIRGGGIRMDVQVGRPFAQPPVRSPKATAKSGSVVTR